MKTICWKKLGFVSLLELLKNLKRRVDVKRCPNGPFAANPCWGASYTLGHPKQRKCDFLKYLQNEHYTINHVNTTQLTLYTLHCLQYASFTAYNGLLILPKATYYLTKCFFFFAFPMFIQFFSLVLFKKKHARQCHLRFSNFSVFCVQICLKRTR